MPMIGEVGESFVTTDLKRSENSNPNKSINKETKTKNTTDKTSSRGQKRCSAFSICSCCFDNNKNKPDSTAKVASSPTAISSRIRDEVAVVELATNDAKNNAARKKKEIPDFFPKWLHKR